MNFAVKSQERPNNCSLSQNRLALSKVGNVKRQEKKMNRRRANEWMAKKNQLPKAHDDEWETKAK